MEYKERFSHDNLVDVFSTATYDSEWLGMHPDDDQKSQQLKKDAVAAGCECREDIWAYVLENGGTLVCFDGNEEKDYAITMEDYKKGFNTFIKKCPRDYADLMTDEGDYFTANNLMQCVMFGDVIYG